MNTIKISKESLKSFQHNMNVAENQLPEPPAMVVLHEDGTSECVSEKELNQAGDGIHRIKALLWENGNDSFSEPIKKCFPQEYEQFKRAYQVLEDAFYAVI